jgi:cation diffusion facilitator family transporter
MALLGNSLAAMFKIFVGMITGSKGLVADGVHSVADAFASALILLALKIAGMPRDQDHPYGYGKVEYISTLIASAFLFICASLILLDTLKSLMYGIHETPGNVALFATLVCFFWSILLYKSNICAGTQLGSPAIIADATESKGDCFSTTAVLIGLIGTKLGFIYADALAAAVVAVLIYHMSIKMLFQGVHGLIDSSSDKEAIDQAVKTSLTVEGVEGVRSINTRRMGQKNWIDLTIDVSEKKSILEIHMIGEKVKEAIIEKLKNVGGISVNCFPVKKTIWGTY